MYVFVYIYKAVYKFDIICLSDSTCLDSKTLPNNDNLDISGYSLVRPNHPCNNKCGGVCIYYKQALPLRVTNVNYLNECRRFELQIGEELCSFISLCRSPSQTLNDIHR